MKSIRGTCARINSVTDASMAGSPLLEVNITATITKTNDIDEFIAKEFRARRTSIVLGEPDYVTAIRLLEEVAGEDGELSPDLYQRIERFLDDHEDGDL